MRWLLLLALLVAGPAAAQNFGNIPPGNIIGNPTTSPAPARPMLPQNGVSPAAFGCSPTAPDNTACLTTALNSGKPIYFDAIYNAVGPITVAGCPDISGGGPNTTGIGITGTAGGLGITCNSPSEVAIGGHIGLRQFGLFAKVPGAGRALSIYFANTDAASKIAVPNLDMIEVHVVGDNALTNYWSEGVLITNAQNCNVQRNWVAGWQNGFHAMAYGILFNIDVGGAAYNCNVAFNTVVGMVDGIAVFGAANAHMEGWTFANNLVVAVTTAFLIDMSTMSYTPPGWFFTSNQTGLNLGDNGYSLFINHASQIAVIGNIFYGSKNNNNILLQDSNTVTIANNPVLNVNGAPSDVFHGAAIQLNNGQIVSIDGNAIYGQYDIGININTTSAVAIGGNNNFTSIPTPVGGTGPAVYPIFRTEILVGGNGVILTSPPTSCTGQAPGTIWNNAGTAKIC